MQCPVCGSKRHAVLHSWPYTKSDFKTWLEKYYSVSPGFDFAYMEGAEYCLLECNDCKLIFQRDIPDETLSRKIYSEWPDAAMDVERHKKSDGLDYYVSYAHAIMRIIRITDMPPGVLRFLDFGMGRGVWARMVAGFGCESWGMELTAEMAENLKSADIKILSIEDNPDIRFDLINVDQVLEHVSNPTNILKKLAALLKPNGMMRIAVPDGGDIKKRLLIMDWSAPRWTSRSLGAVHPLEHINCFNRVALLKAAGLAGLDEIPDAKRSSFPAIIATPPLPGKVSAAKYLLRLRAVAHWAKKEWSNNFHRLPTEILLYKKENG